MATITLRKDKINGVGGLIDSMVKSSNNLDTQLGTLRNTLQGVDSSTCNLQGVVESISSSSKSEKAKVADLKRLNSKLTDFITMTANRDASAKSAVERAKNDFYSKYSYLKPECEKGALEHIRDGIISAAEWCKKHWKLIVVAIIVVVSIVVLCIPGVGPIIAGACWGALLGACLGGVSGGLESMANGGSFLDGFEDGALTGAITGAISGAAMAGLGVLGGSLGKFVQCGSTLGKFVKGTAAVTKVLSTGMGAFDMLAMADRYLGNGDIAALNAKLHESQAYNIFQTGVSAVAVFTGGMTTTMKCFVAGTLVLTVNGLVAIEEIKQGDMVYAANADTLKISPRRVLETFVRETSHLVHLTVNGETIVSTFDHPYYVKGKGFVNAADLWVGAELVDKSGNTVLVENLYREDLDNKTTTVYNFKVEDDHTYFVSDFEILVHNADYDKTVAQLKINKENGKKFNQQLEKIANDNPNTEMVATEVPMNVEGGKQYRADLIIQKKNGKLIYVEGKASPTATYTKGQKIDFANNNNKLIGNAKFTKKGTNIFGTKTGPKAGTTIHRIQPDNIQDLIKLLNN